MEWMQPAIEAGAITVVAIAIVFVAVALYKMSGTIPSLTAAMGTMAGNTSDAIADGKEERETYQESSRLLVAEIQGLTTALIAFTAEVKSGQAAQVGELATLTDKIGTLETAMIDHTTEEPSRADLMKEVQDLRKVVQELRGEVKQAMATFNDTIKRSTQEISAAATPPPESQTAGQKAAQQVVEAIKSNVDKLADTPPKGIQK